jgi:hypothetical protein
MKFATTLLAALLCLAASAWAQDQAFTNRSTELKDKGAAEAKTVSTLPANTAVKIMARAGAWTQVQADNVTGWVRAFHLRFPVAIEKGSQGALGSISSIFGGGSRERQASATGTLGVRGLTPDELKNAAPDGAALQKAQSYRADKPAAERFAREGRLASVNVDEGGGR